MRSRVAPTACLLLVSLTAALAQQAGQCRQLVFGGKVMAGERFTREIGDELSFRVDPWREGSGWEFEIGPTAPAPDEWNQYVYTVTPPYRSSGPRDINTGWGTPAQDAVRGPRTFAFLLRRADSKTATAALDAVLWPASDAAQEGALKTLAALPQGRGEFLIVDAKITPGTPVPGYSNCEPGRCGQIHWIRFQVRLTVPRAFKPAAGLSAAPVPCPGRAKR